jgi:hypothetical protein
LVWFAVRQVAEALSGWTLRTSLLLAAGPAVIYMFQNLAINEAYRHLTPVTFSIVNQTKVCRCEQCHGDHVM